MLSITAKITGIKYVPFLCKQLEEICFNRLENELHSRTSFILKLDNLNKIALSWWVSAKRTRSYPYARVYDTLSFSGKKATIIPVLKDEGAGGDRDFLQWDTISLMSLLDVYVIIAYYNVAEPSQTYPTRKITNQRYDVKHVSTLIEQIACYSDAKHWNIAQSELVSQTGERALQAYSEISNTLGIPMHSNRTAHTRFQRIADGAESFKRLSRIQAQNAQQRETRTIQPKERTSGKKAAITIENYLGGQYFLTCDEVRIDGSNIYLIEAKHSRTSVLPSLEDIKDGLIKMWLFTNLAEVAIQGKIYHPIPALKLTSAVRKSDNPYLDQHKSLLNILQRESEKNGFVILYD